MVGLQDVRKYMVNIYTQYIRTPNQTYDIYIYYLLYSANQRTYDLVDIYGKYLYIWLFPKF